MIWLMVACSMFGADFDTEAPDGVVPVAEGDDVALEEPPPAADAAPSAPSAADAWVVIVGSSPDQAHSFDNLDALSTLTAPKGPVIIDSSSVEGLTPCLKVALGGIERDRAAGFERLDAVKKAGVEGYLKRAGAATGLTNATDPKCAAATGPLVCASGVRLAERWGNKVFVELVSAREGDTAPAGLEPVDGDFSAWTAPLPDKRVEGVAVGDLLSVVDNNNKSHECKVSGLVSLVRGVPHFGYQQEAGMRAPTAPGCGAPVVAAQLDCAVADPRFVRASTSPAVRVLSKVALTPAQEKGATMHVWGMPSLPALQASAGQSATDARPLTRKLELTGWRLGDTTWVHARVAFITGEGEDMCGAEDVYVGASALLREKDGRWNSSGTLAPLHHMESVLLVDVDGDGLPERRVERFGDRFGLELLSPTGSSVCAVDVPYCDSPC